MTGDRPPSPSRTGADLASPPTDAITDDFMRERLAKSKEYTVVLLKKHGDLTGADQIVWEHGRRNLALSAEGTLPIVCPVTDGSDWAGVGIFDASQDEVTRILKADPGVKAGIFTYEIHPVRGFPGSSLS